MIEKVKQTLEKYDLLDSGDRVLVALSGGPDSTALLMVLVQLAKDMNLTLFVAHFNHGLRGRESNADEKFSRDLAKKMGLLFCSAKIDKSLMKKGVSPEDYYRRQRYEFLHRAAKEYRANKIALGHHLQDQAETVLLNLLRGSGPGGLKGFLPKRDGKFVRPLMETSRQEIISFLEQSGIAYRRDSSNENRMYLRNQIRAELIPYLQEKYNPKIVENLARTAEILRVEDEFIREQVARVLSSRFVQRADNRFLMKIDYLKKLSTAVRWRLLKTVLEDLTPRKNGITFLHVTALDQLIQKRESGKRIIFPSKIEARREYNVLIVEKIPRKQIQFEYIVDVPGTVQIPEKNVIIETALIQKNRVDFGNKNTVYLDWDKIRRPLIIRNRRDGDWFQPMGMAGRQKIKNFFIDHKIPAGKRDNVLLMVDGISVIAIENTHVNERVKITGETKKVLQLKINDF